MSNEIEDIVIPILQNIQGDLAVVKTDIGVLKENTGKIDLRLKAVESHMSGFMSTSKYFEAEMDELRGRVEDLAKDHDPDNPPT